MSLVKPTLSRLRIAPFAFGANIKHLNPPIIAPLTAPTRSAFSSSSNLLQCRHRAHPNSPNIICRNYPTHRVRRIHNASPIRQTRAVPSAIDPTAFVLAAVLSASVAYLFAKTFPQTGVSSADEQSDCEAIVLVNDEMAANTAPGRPGNLTPEQEIKLKEMWAQLLEIYGIAPPGSRARADTATSENPEGKKKKRSRLSLFGSKKDKDGEDEDKHGQTKDFEAALSADNPAELRTAFWNLVKHDNPDAIVLRYLRARKWDVQAAIVMLVSTLHWTLSSDPYKIIAEGEGHAVAQTTSSDPSEKKAGEEFIQICNTGKSFIHGHDIDGRPVVYIRARLHRSGQEADATMERFTIYTIETTRLFLTPTVDTATLVFDLQSFTLANMDYAPVKFMIKCFEANYPESLGAVVVYSAPWIFSSIWKVIKGWLDPVVASKIHFENDIEGLEKYLGPRSRVIKELGGDEHFEYKFTPPIADENAVMRNVADRDAIRAERKPLQEKYEAETLAWVNGTASEEQNAKRFQTAAELTQNYWRLDPYIRARTLYDRIGVLQPGGKTEHYPTATATTTAAPPAPAAT